MASDIVVKVGADASEFNDAIEEMRKKSSTLSDSLFTITKASGAAFGAIVADATHAILSFKESEAVSKNLALALRNQGLDADKLGQKYDKLAQSVSEKTKFDDDQVKSGFAVLQSFIGQQEIGDELATTLLNLAAKSGSVEGAAQELGRAFQGNTRGLKQYGIVVDQSLSLSERQAAVIKAVAGNFDGLAESQGKGLGSLDRLKKSFDDIQKAIGERLAPIVGDLAGYFADLFNEIKNNGPLLDFIVEIGKLVFIATGFVAVASGVVGAFVAIGAAISTLTAFIGGATLATQAFVGATGIGLLIILAAQIYANWGKIFPALQAIVATFVNNAAELFSGFGMLIKGAFSLDTAAIKAGLAEIKGAFAKNFKEIEDTAAKTKTTPPVGNSGADEKQVAAAKARAAELKRVDEAQLEAKQAHYDAQLAAQQGFSESTVKLIEDESATLKALAETTSADEIAILENKLAMIEALEIQAIDDDLARQQEFNAIALENNKVYQDLDTQGRADFLARNQATLQASLDSTALAKQKAAAAEAKVDIDKRNAQLADQAKYGVAYAAINAVIHSGEVDGTKQAAGELVALQGSKNSVLKAIGKGAAIAQITIKTAEAAMNVYAGFQFLPFGLGIPLGLAAAGAVVAFGAEQIAGVISAQSGGIVPGFNTGGDSVPAVLQPGELVVPRQNFSQVVQAVAARQVQEDADLNVAQPTASPASQGGQAITIGFDGGEAEKVLTARRVEARSLGTLREARV